MARTKSIDLSALILKLNTSSDKAADKVIKQLVVLGNSAVPELIRAAKDESKPRVRKWSLHALGAIGDRRAASLLIDALDDERMTVKLHAIKGLRKMKHRAAAKKISKLLKDDSGGIRVNALYALTDIKEPATLPQIQKSLSDPQWYVRQSACVACGVLNGVKAKSKLKKLQNSDDRKAVREAAAEALVLLNT